MVLMSLVAWGNRHYAMSVSTSVELVERETGRRCSGFRNTDGQVVPLDQCTLQAGPAASLGMRDAGWHCSMQSLE